MGSSSSFVLSLREQVAERIRNDVLCGRLQEGYRLSEQELVSRFGVSRTPVREALRQLTQEGILEGRWNAGVKVASRPSDDLIELIVPIRRTVEVFALRCIYPNLEEADYVRWSAILDQLRTACREGDYASIAEHDIAFHRSIIHRAGKPDLNAIWASMIARVRSHFWETQNRNYAGPMEIYQEHAQIIETFRAGNIEAAVKALEENIG